MDVINRIDRSIPARYRRLVGDVLRRLPQGWDRGAAWRVIASNGVEAKGFAHVGGTARGVQLVTLYPNRMDQLSDDACRFVIAHELAHVAPLLPVHAIINGKHCLFVDGQWKRASASAAWLEECYETVADQLAHEWGFSEEASAFEREIVGRPGTK